MDPRPSRNVLLVLVGLLFAAVAVAAALTDPQVARVPAPTVEFGDAGFSGDSGRRDRAEDLTAGSELDRGPGTDGVASPGLGWLSGLGLLVLLAVGLAVMWRTMRDRKVTLRPTPASGVGGQERRREQARRVVAAGLDELAAEEGDPRAAVIGCWLRLERAAAAAGVAREAADAPADLVARMLAGHEVSGPVLERFAAVYREARYAPHQIGETMRDEARTALERLHAELSASREVPG